MPLTYGFQSLSEEDREEKFAKLTDQEKQIFHDVLPWVMMSVDIGWVSPGSITAIIERSKLACPEMSKYLTEEFLGKVIGYSANVSTIALAEDWLADRSHSRTMWHKELTVHKDDGNWAPKGWGFEDEGDEYLLVMKLSPVCEDDDDDDDMDYEKLVEPDEDEVGAEAGRRIWGFIKEIYENSFLEYYNGDENDEDFKDLLIHLAKDVRVVRTDHMGAQVVEVLKDRERR